MPSKLTLVAIAAGFYAACSQGGIKIKEPAMKTVEPLEVYLKVGTTGKAVPVNLQILNPGNVPVLIEKIPLDSSQPLPHEFFVTSDGKEVEYIGPMIKRSPYARGDFRWLQPGEKVERNLSIEKLFNFLPGTHKYKIVYIYLGFDETTGQVVEHESAPEFFFYTKEVVSQFSR